MCAIHCVVLLLVFGECGDVTDGSLMAVCVCAIHCVVLVLVFGKCGDVTDGGLCVRDPVCRALTCVWGVW